MLKTIRELVDDARSSGNWSAVADWCETYDWSEADKVPTGEFDLWRAVRMGGGREDQLVEAVASARAGGATWSRIGEILGFSGLEARQLYGAAIDEAEAETISQ